MGRDSLRIALVSTPRSGNMWLRLVLGRTLNLVDIPVHNYLEAPDPLPDRCIMQIHWYREPNFQAWLRQHEFVVVVLARHPLDVLISALQFIRRDYSTRRWLEGNVEIPDSLVGASPVSPIFKHFALGWGSENLLSISYQWWHDAAALKIKYEDLSADPEHAFSELMAVFGVEKADAVAGVRSLDFNSLKNLPNKHGWQGRPGLWRELVVPMDALLIYWRHRRVFQTLGYTAIPQLISRKRAQENWERLVNE